MSMICMHRGTRAITARPHAAPLPPAPEPLRPLCCAASFLDAYLACLPPFRFPPLLVTASQLDPGLLSLPESHASFPPLARDAFLRVPLSTPHLCCPCCCCCCCRGGNRAGCSGERESWRQPRGRLGPRQVRPLEAPLRSLEAQLQALQEQRRLCAPSCGRPRALRAGLERCALVGDSRVT